MPRHPHHAKKRPEPANVHNPSTTGHSVPLHPLQALNLTLPAPQQFEQAEEGANWQVEAHSDFLRLAQVEFVYDPSHQVVFRFDQYYDLSSWVKYGGVCMGVISCRLARKGGGCVRDVDLFVYCKDQQDRDVKVMTVINPTGLVKLEPTQILELVVSDDVRSTSMRPPRSTVYGVENSKIVKNGSALMEKLREETVYSLDNTPVRQDKYTPYKVINREIRTLPDNPYLAEEDRARRTKVPITCVTRQHHVWYRFDQSFKEVNKEVVNTLFMPPHVCNVTVGDNDHSYLVNVLLCQRSVIKDGWPKEDDKDNVKAWGLQYGLTDHYQSIPDGLLINPKSNSTHEIGQNEEMYLEISPPNMFWPAVPDAKRWQHTIQCVSEDGKDQSRVIVTPIPDRIVNGRSVQRYLIRPTNSARLRMETESDLQMFFLGTITFTCKEVGSIGQRQVLLWMMRQKTASKMHVTPVSVLKRAEYTIPSSTAGTVKPRHSSDFPLVPQAPIGRIMPPPTSTTYYPYRDAIEIVEKYVTLEEASYEVVKFSNITQRYPEKNRRRQNQDEWYYYDQQERQKKNQTPPPRFEGGSEKVAERERRTSQSQTSSPNSEDDGKVIVSDPKNGQYVILRPSQTLVVSIPILYWGQEYDLQHFWTCTPLFPGKPKFWLSGNRLIMKSDATKYKYHQEIKVEVSPQFLRQKRNSVGRHLMGMLKFENAHSVVNLLVFFEIEKPLTDQQLNDTHRITYLSEIVRLHSAAREDMERREEAERKDREFEAALAQMEQPGVRFGEHHPPLTLRDQGIVHAVEMTDGEMSRTQLHVKPNDRIRVVLPGDLQLQEFPDWLHYTKHRTNEHHQVYEFEMDTPKAQKTGKGQMMLSFRNTISNVVKGIKVILSA